MALKDITLGQYFPGSSPVHKLDPRTKLIAVLLYIVALFLAKWFVTYAIMFVVLAAAVAISQVPLKSLVSGMKPVVFILVFTGILNPSIPPASTCWPSSGSLPSPWRVCSRPSSWWCGF